MVKIYLKINEINNVLDNIDGLSEKIVNNVATNLLGNLKMESPVDEGKLQGSWSIFDDGPNQKTAKSSANYAEYVNSGTGLYGPHKTLIRPTTKKALKFTPNKGKFKGMTIFTPYSRGIKPNPYVERSIEKTEKRIPELVIHSINQAKLG